MHPIFLRIGTFEIRWYGVMVAIGFLVAVWVGNKRAKKAGFAPDIIPNLCFWIILAAFVGARAVYVALNWREYSGHPLEMLRIDHGGIVFYGGLAGGVLAALAYSRIKNQDFFLIADVLSPSLALAHAFGRIGCFFNSCCYGKSCSLPWGVEFPLDSLPAQAGLFGPLHPTQLYESVFLFYLCFALMLIDSMKKFRGQTFASYGLLYSLFRFTIEFWRGDVPRVLLQLTVAQWSSLLIFGVSWWWLTRQRKRWAVAKRAEAIARLSKSS